MATSTNRVHERAVKRAEIGKKERAYFVPSGKQMEALRLLENPVKTRILLDGGARSGKTDVIAHWLFTRCVRYPGSWHLVLKKQRVHVRDSLWYGTFHKYLNMYWSKAYYTEYKEEMWFRMWNGSRIIFEGADDESRVRKLYGNEYMTIWFNEASEFQWRVVERLMSRLAQRCIGGDGEVGGCKAVFDTNPSGPRHWLHRVGVMGVDPEDGEAIVDRENWGRLGGWTPYDNAGNLSKDAMKTYESMKGVTKRQLLWGEWCTNEGMVYDEFDFDRDVVEPVKDEEVGKVFKGVFRGIDFGYRDPFVCLWVGLDFDGVLVVFKERYVRNMIVSDHAMYIKKQSLEMGVWWTVADHDAEDSETLRREGIITRRAKKDRPMQAGIDRVKKRMGEGGIKVTRNCRNVLGEIGGYIWDEGKDRPVGNDDHAMDVLRYVVAECDSSTGSELVGF